MNRGSATHVGRILTAFVFGGPILAGLNGSQVEAQTTSRPPAQRGASNVGTPRAQTASPALANGGQGVTSAPQPGDFSDPNWCINLGFRGCVNFLEGMPGVSPTSFYADLARRRIREFIPPGDLLNYLVQLHNPPTSGSGSAAVAQQRPFWRRRGPGGGTDRSKHYTIAVIGPQQFNSVFRTTRPTSALVVRDCDGIHLLVPSSASPSQFAYAIQNLYLTWPLVNPSPLRVQGSGMPYQMLAISMSGPQNMNPNLTCFVYQGSRTQVQSISGCQSSGSPIPDALALNLSPSCPSQMRVPQTVVAAIPPPQTTTPAPPAPENRQPVTLSQTVFSPSLEGSVIQSTPGEQYLYNQLRAVTDTTQPRSLSSTATSGQIEAIQSSLLNVVRQDGISEPAAINEATTPLGNGPSGPGRENGNGPQNQNGEGQQEQQRAMAQALDIANRWTACQFDMCRCTQSGELQRLRASIDPSLFSFAVALGALPIVRTRGQAYWDCNCLSTSLQAQLPPERAGRCPSRQRTGEGRNAGRGGPGGGPGEGNGGSTGNESGPTRGTGSGSTGEGEERPKGT